MIAYLRETSKPRTSKMGGGLARCTQHRIFPPLPFFFFFFSKSGREKTKRTAAQKHNRGSSSLPTLVPFTRSGKLSGADRDIKRWTGSHVREYITMPDFETVELNDLSCEHSYLYMYIHQIAEHKKNKHKKKC